MMERGVVHCVEGGSGRSVSCLGAADPTGAEVSCLCGVQLRLRLNKRGKDEST